MKKQAYLAALMAQPLEWIRRSANSPNRFMTKMHVSLHHVAIRKLTRQGPARPSSTVRFEFRAQGNQQGFSAYQRAAKEDHCLKGTQIAPRQST